MVENAITFEDGKIRLKEPLEKVIVPQGITEVVKVGGEHIELYIDKRLNFHGHPPRPISYKALLRYMGLAFFIENGVLTLATYGEWSSKEGGVEMKVQMILPKGIKLLEESGLCGEESRANGDCTGPPRWGQYWYGATRPRKGWKRVKTKVSGLDRMGTVESNGKWGREIKV